MSKPAVHEKKKWVRLTRACNNRCLFCLDAEALDGGNLPLSAIRAELLAGHKEGCRRAVLSGGEPTLHPEFTGVIALARKLGYRHIQVISNGRFFCYEDFLREAVLAGLNEITFSVHGLNSATHDKLVGVKGALSQTVQGICNALKIPGLIISSDIVVNKINVDSLEGILRFLYKLGVREYDLLQIMPFGRAWRHWRRLYYNPAQKKNALRRAFAFSHIPGVHLWVNRFRPEWLEGREELIQDPEKLLDEINGRSEMFADFLCSNGRLSCAGARCSYCPLEQFCLDLRTLRDQGGLLQLPNALCSGAASEKRARLPASAGLGEAGRFFIKNRLAFKGSACTSCIKRNICAGIGIYKIMSSGFGAVKPFKVK